MVPLGHEFLYQLNISICQSIRVSRGTMWPSASLACCPLSSLTYRSTVPLDTQGFPQPMCPPVTFLKAQLLQSSLCVYSLCQQPGSISNWKSGCHSEFVIKICSLYSSCHLSAHPTPSAFLSGACLHPNMRAKTVFYKKLSPSFL